MNETNESVLVNPLAIEPWEFVPGLKVELHKFPSGYLNYGELFHIFAPLDVYTVAEVIKVKVPYRNDIFCCRLEGQKPNSPWHAISFFVKASPRKLELLEAGKNVIAEQEKLRKNIIDTLYNNVGSATLSAIYPDGVGKTSTTVNKL